MVGVDTSALIEFLRATGSRVDRTLDRLLDDPAVELCITDVVLMEVLSGARSAGEVRELTEELLSMKMLRLEPLRGYQDAADLYLAARRQGLTIRKMTDCLIAVPMIEAGASLLHADADFDRIAQVAPLRIEPVVP